MSQVGWGYVPREGVGGGGVLSTMTYTGRLRPKAVPFSGFRYMKGYVREICHSGLWNGPKGRTNEFYGFKKVGKTF